MNVQDMAAIFGFVIVEAQVIIWAVRLEGRMNMINQRVEQLERVAEAHVKSSEQMAIMRNDMDHMKGDISELKSLMIALVPPSQRLKRQLTVGE